MQEIRIEENVPYLTQLFSLLGDKNRLLILQSLVEGERNVGELQALLQTSQANVSKHLRKLREGNLIVREVRGNQTFHTVASPLVVKLCTLAINENPGATEVADTQEVPSSGLAAGPESPPEPS